MSIGRQWLAVHNLAASTYGPGGQLGDQPLLSILPGGPATNQIANPAGLTDSKGNAVTCTRASTKYCRTGSAFDSTNGVTGTSEWLPATWAGTGTIDTSVPAPGLPASVKQVDTAFTGLHGFAAIQVSNSVVNTAAAWTASAYVKAGTSNFAGLTEGAGSSGVMWNLTTGAVLFQSGAVTNPTSTDMGGGWWRVAVTFTGAGGAGDNIYLLNNPSGTLATAPSYLGAGAYFYAAGWKAEQGSTATAYVRPMLVSMAANVPSVEPEGLLVEGASTNVCIQSQTFDNAAWTKSTVTVTADQAIAPDGTLTADQLAFASGASLITGTNAVASAAIYSASVYLAPVSGSGKINLVIRDVTAGTDLATYTGSALNAGWQRISVTLPSNAVAGNNLAVRLTCTAAVTAYAWGAQLEVVLSATSAATSYVPTVAASATRTADAVSIANPLTASAFALAATMTPPGAWTDSTNGLGLGVQFTNNSAYFYTSGSGLGLGVTDNAGGFKAYEMTNGLAPGSTHRIAFANSGGLTTAYLDGTAMSTTPGGTGTNTITTQPATFILANGASFGTFGYHFHSIKLGTTIGSVK